MKPIRIRNTAAILLMAVPACFRAEASDFKDFIHVSFEVFEINQDWLKQRGLEAPGPWAIQMVSDYKAPSLVVPGNRLTTDSSVESLNMYFDKYKLSKIMMNLLSNAFKYTDKGGTVDVRISQSGENVEGIITGKTPIEFIRLIRLKRAAQYLAQSQMYISEIAYKVGFNNPRLMSKYFKEEYNMTPREYIRSLGLDGDKKTEEE